MTAEELAQVKFEIPWFQLFWHTFPILFCLSVCFAAAVTGIYIYWKMKG